MTFGMNGLVCDGRESDYPKKRRHYSGAREKIKDNTKVHSAALKKAKLAAMSLDLSLEEYFRIPRQKRPV